MKFTYIALVLACVDALKISSEKEKWERNLPDLYSGASQVKELSASHANYILDKISKDSTDAKLPGNKAQLVEAYHPNCKSCKSFEQDYEQLAGYLKEKGIPIDVSAINFSKQDDLSLNIDAYPTFRLYTDVGKFKEFDGDDLTLDSMKKWLLQYELKV